MIRKPNYILMDDHGKEFQEKSMHSINLTVNDGDIHQFVAGHIPSHWHKRLEIFLLLEGKVSVSTGDNTCKLHAGDGCFINTEVLHSFTADTASPCLYRSFVFSADIVGGAPGSIFDTTYVRPLLENGASFLKFQKENGDTIYFEQFQRAFTACVSEEYGYEFSVRNALSNIMLYIASKSATVTKRSIPSVQEARLKKMLLWIDGHFDENIRVSDIAGAASICTRECQRIFQQYLHYSPVEYLRRKRIFNAAKLLSDTDRPVTEVALGCGFSNPGYFSRQFRELMGSTPGQYRSDARENL
ncbi:MAG: AraC family transcriptional regulator [Lachnospiraceae bacterium]